MELQKALQQLMHPDTVQSPSQSSLQTCDLTRICRCPDLKTVVTSLVKAVHDLYLGKDQPVWMVSCSDADLRKHGSYEPGPDDMILGEQDWGNNAGSVLVILMIRFGLKCCTDELNLGTVKFAQSSRGPDNCRTNYVECLLGEWKGTPARHQVRELLKHAWRLCFVALSVSWKDELSNCHELAEAVLDCSPTLLPGGAFSNQEANLHKQLCSTWTYTHNCWVVERVKELPDVQPRRSSDDLHSDGNFPSNALLRQVLGLKSASSTFKLVKDALWQLWQRQMPHRGDPLRFCFECDQVPESSI